MNCVFCLKEMRFEKQIDLFGAHFCLDNNHCFRVSASDWTFHLTVFNDLLKIRSIGCIAGKPYSFEMNSNIPDFEMSKTYSVLLKLNNLTSFM